MMKKLTPVYAIGSLFMGSDGSFIGPGHTAIITVGKQDMVSCHFYNATQNGASFFAIRPLTWDADGWPVAGLAQHTDTDVKSLD